VFVPFPLFSPLARRIMLTSRLLVLRTLCVAARIKKTVSKSSKSKTPEVTKYVHPSLLLSLSLEFKGQNLILCVLRL
jgi:hypothetical protein